MSGTLGWLRLSILLLIPALGLAQRLAVDLHQVKVITIDGQRVDGILYDVTETALFVGYGTSAATVRPPFDEGVDLVRVKKVIIRRLNKRKSVLTGAVLGGLLTVFVTNQSLQKSPPRSASLYGVSLVLGAGIGAGVGAFVGNLIGNPTRRVVRPHDPANPSLSLYRELRPFSYQYQIDLMDRLPRNHDN